MSAGVTSEASAQRVGSDTEERRKPRDGDRVGPVAPSERHVVRGARGICPDQGGQADSFTHEMGGVDHWGGLEGIDRRESGGGMFAPVGEEGLDGLYLRVIDHRENTHAATVACKVARSTVQSCTARHAKLHDPGMGIALGSRRIELEDLASRRVGNTVAAIGPTCLAMTAYSRERVDHLGLRNNTGPATVTRCAKLTRRRKHGRMPPPSPPWTRDTPGPSSTAEHYEPAPQTQPPPVHKGPSRRHP